MALTNQERIGKMLDLLRTGLSPSSRTSWRMASVTALIRQRFASPARSAQWTVRVATAARIQSLLRRLR
jgi:hypothetical protein